MGIQRGVAEKSQVACEKSHGQASLSIFRSLQGSSSRITVEVLDWAALFESSQLEPSPDRANEVEVLMKELCSGYGVLIH